MAKLHSIIIVFFAKVHLMTADIYRKVELFVVDNFRAAGDGVGANHVLRTVHWLKELKPDADEALLIAAVAHDIERALRDHKSYDKVTKFEKGFRSDEHLTYHQEEGARIIGEYLEQIGAGENTIKRVKELVSRHETGGDDGQNLLKDADSVSFFENVVEHFLTRKVHETGRKKVKDKLDWMYGRITSDQAKALARQGYRESIKKLELDGKL